MFPPSDEELEEARKLGVKAEGKSAPQLRKDIAAALKKRELEQHAFKEYRRLVEACRWLGIDVSGGPKAPKKSELERLLDERLPAALIERGIIEGAVIEMPSDSGLFTSGRAVVGEYWPPKGGNPAVITLRFDREGRGFTRNALLVYMHAVVPGRA